jgi:Hedgehog amino-terminal signalling domain
MARTTTSRTRSRKKGTQAQSLHDLVRNVHGTLGNASRPIRRIEASIGNTRLAIEFAVLDSADTPGVSSELVPGEKVPNQSEIATVGPFTKRIHRSDPEFAALVSNANAAIDFKDEERTGADRIMTNRLKTGLDALALLVQQEWTGVRLRVTEAWDENGEHSPRSLHYEGRAADLTTSPIDGTKLGRLGRLAVDAGLDWVFFEDTRHIHVSAK